MTSIIFVAASGAATTVQADSGMSVMEAAVRNGIDGIDADCGGQLSCATCHVHVDEQWGAQLPPPTADESDLLEFAPGRDGRSRLSCQVIVTDDLDGLTVEVPEHQM